MNTETRQLSAGFQQLLLRCRRVRCVQRVAPHQLRRVLPFQAQDPVVDDPRLIAAEAAHLASRTDTTRRDVVEAYRQCSLLPEEEAASLKPVVDYFDADFFELMGEVYANAGMFICALRWHRELSRSWKRNPPILPPTRKACMQAWAIVSTRWACSRRRSRGQSPASGRVRWRTRFAGC